MNHKQLIDELFNTEKYNDLSSFVNAIRTVHRAKLISTSTSNILISKQFLDEIKTLSDRSDIELFFGNSLRDLKCIFSDENGREHSCYIKYLGENKLKVCSSSLPFSDYQSVEYKFLEEIIDAFRNYVSALGSYFYELQRIDTMCYIVEPVIPTLKENFRKILLEDRVWLHVEVRPDGSPDNIHLIGKGDLWQEKLQSGIMNWDHDKDIVDNLMCLFDLDEFPGTNLGLSHSTRPRKKIECSICLCEELAGITSGLPKPLCLNIKCDTYYHTECLYKWLVARAGGLAPKLGIASGQCPYCLKYISCSL